MTPRTQLAILASAMVLPAVMLNCAGSRADQESWPDASALPSPSSPSGQPNFGSVPAPDAHAASPLCEKPPQPADPALVEMSPAFSKYYETYLLGPVPGIPSSRLGGCVLSSSDPNTLLVAVRSEDAEGAIYAVPLKREACGHIVGFDGPATPVAQTPHVDANLIYGPNNVLFYSEWPVNAISQLLPNATSRARRDALAWIGVGGGGPGGLGFVPPNLQDPGGFRALTRSAGYWYHLD